MRRTGSKSEKTRAAKSGEKEPFGGSGAPCSGPGWDRPGMRAFPSFAAFGAGDLGVVSSVERERPRNGGEKEKREREKKERAGWLFLSLKTPPASLTLFSPPRHDRRWRAQHPPRSTTRFLFDDDEPAHLIAEWARTDVVRSVP